MNKSYTKARWGYRCFAYLAAEAYSASKLSKVRYKFKKIIISSTQKTCGNTDFCTLLITAKYRLSPNFNLIGKNMKYFLKNIIAICLIQICFSAKAQNYSWHQSIPLEYPLVDNSVQKPGYKLIFNDEFNSSSINAAVWERSNYFVSNNIDLYVFVDDLYHVYSNQCPGKPTYELGYNNYINSNTLKINANYQKPPCSMWHSNNNGISCIPKCPENVDYTTGEMRTTFNIKHGYFEIRCKIPQGDKTMWPAFWLFFGDGDVTDPNILNIFNRYGAEIDVFEIVEDKTSVIGTNYHYPVQDAYKSTFPCTGGYLCDDGQDITINLTGNIPDLSEDFYTYGLGWEGNRLDFYLNNKLIRSVENCRVPISHMKLILSNGLSPYFLPNALNFPKSFEIDYVRIYKKIYVEDFGYVVGGYRNDKHIRTVADVNGDGLADIVAFGGAGVYVALAYKDNTGFGFRYPNLVLANFGYDDSAGGYRNDKHIRTVADVNGDGLADIVAFGGAGVYEMV